LETDRTDFITIQLQWRRQTIKSGSAFKGQLYFEVGQMEGRLGRRKAPECRGDGSGERRHSLSPLGGLRLCPEKFSEINYDRNIAHSLHCLHFANWSGLICTLQCRQGFRWSNI